MALMKRMLSSVGIGAATVDTVLYGERFAPGDLINGAVNITGGGVEQRIEGIDFAVHCACPVETDDGTVTVTALVGSFRLAEALVIGPGATKTLPVAVRLPYATPLTLGRTRVWVQTGLDIRQAVDPSDTDAIEVVPNRLVQALFDALGQLGFRLVQVECERASGALGGGIGIVQEFEFKPQRGPFRGRLDELEIICLPAAERVEVRMEIDRKARGMGSFLAQMMGMDETRTKFVYGPADLPTLVGQLQQFIGRWS